MGTPATAWSGTIEGFRIERDAEKGKPYISPHEYNIHFGIKIMSQVGETGGDGKVWMRCVGASGDGGT